MKLLLDVELSSFSTNGPPAPSYHTVLLQLTLFTVTDGVMTKPT